MPYEQTRRLCGRSELSASSFAFSSLGRAMIGFATRLAFGPSIAHATIKFCIATVARERSVAHGRTGLVADWLGSSERTYNRLRHDCSNDGVSLDRALPWE
jgi:hypothetical protein